MFSPPPLLLFTVTLSFLTTTTTTTHFPKEALPTLSGYLPISESTSLFFTFYEARHPLTPSSTPLLLWLEGGPGCSSQLGNFFQLGPFLLDLATDSSLSPNPFSWNRRFGLLFLDSPLGSGFSAAPSAAAIPRNQSAVSAHVFAALQSFMELNSTYRTRPFFLSGESYAGKFIPAVGSYILARNAKLPAHLRVNLHGAAIGNGLTHPVAQVATHADAAYFTGMLDAKQKAALEAMQAEAVALTKAEKWREASDARGRVLSWLQNVTGLATLYDFTKSLPYQIGAVSALLNTAEAKAALGARADVAWEVCSEAVAAAMHEDIMKSAKHDVEEMVKSGTRVLLYQGVYDLRDGVVSTEAWVREMEWDGLERFLAAERAVWRLGGELAGYVQQSGPLANVVVNRAGHFVPADAGAAAQVMIEDWVLGKGLFGGGGGGGGGRGDGMRISSRGRRPWNRNWIYDARTLCSTGSRTL